MIQAVLKLRKSNIIGLALDPDFRSRTLNIVLVTFGVLSVCYILVVGSIIFNIIERKALEAEARVLSGSIGELELNYLSFYQNLDAVRSTELGFVEVKPNFVTRTSLGQNTPKGSGIKVGRNEI